MTENENTDTLSKDRIFFPFILICGIITAGIGAAALFGWIAGLPLLATFWSGRIPMAPSTALLFLLYGAGTTLFARAPLTRAAYRAGMFIGVFGAFSSLLLLFLSLMGINSTFEHLGMHIAETVSGAIVGHMSPVTAFCFILSGIAFLSMLLPSDRPNYYVLALGLAFLTFLAGFSLVFAYLIGLPFLYGTSIIPPALSTSLAFCILGAGLISYSWNKIAGNDRSRDSESRRSMYALILIFLSLSAGIIMGGYLYFRDYEHKYRISIEQELSAIHTLKVEELMHWRDEIVGDASVFFRNRAISELVRQHLDKPEDIGVREQLLEWMGKIRGLHEGNQVRLLDLQGLTRLAVPSSLKPASTGELKGLAESVLSGRPSITDFYRSENDGQVYLAVAIPIFDDLRSENILGIMSLRIDPEEYLYPLILSWPTPSETAETLLVRRDGDEVIFLNELRHRRDTALSLRFTTAKKDLPAVMAVQGTTGIVEGFDYRGVKVVASIGPIPDSPWFIVSKMDEEEVYAPIRKSLRIVVFVVVLLLFGSGLGIGLVWRQQRASYYKQRFKAELELNEERKKAAEELSQYMAELERSNKELQQFAYIASHDLQEPLRMIASYLQLIEKRYKGKLDKDADEFIEFAVAGASRLQEMIIGLLAYSRVETKGEVPGEVDSADVVSNAVDNLRLAIEESGTVVTFDSLPVIRADAKQLLQVFQNLISNAIKFRGSEPLRIHISAEQKDDEWVFSVKDNGIGIEPQYKDKVFDMFRRLHGREYPGVGIGLSLCRRIIERHKGRIWLESEYGKGTVFNFTIPR